jgi:hypothetical protein
MARPRSWRLEDHLSQDLRVQVVFPNIPFRLIFIVGVGDFRRAHGEQQAAAIRRGGEVFHVVERGRAVGIGREHIVGNHFLDG